MNGRPETGDGGRGGIERRVDCAGVRPRGLGNVNVNSSLRS
jgi:hypothetical protein